MYAFLHAFTLSFQFSMEVLVLPSLTAFRLIFQLSPTYLSLISYFSIYYAFSYISLTSWPCLGPPLTL